MLLFKVEAFKPHHCEQIPQCAGRNMTGTINYRRKPHCCNGNSHKTIFISQVKHMHILFMQTARKSCLSVDSHLVRITQTAAECFMHFLCVAGC